MSKGSGWRASSKRERRDSGGFHPRAHTSGSAIESMLAWTEERPPLGVRLGHLALEAKRGKIRLRAAATRASPAHRSPSHRSQPSSKNLRRYQPLLPALR
eukprot:scaffold221578_cov23-Tisochrysis_lutea.AAC.2